MRRILLTTLILTLFFSISDSQINLDKNPSAVTVSRLKYDGGGNWYWGRSAIPNLHKFLSENTAIEVHDEEVTVTATDPQLFKYPFLFLTGHGNISFSEKETAALRTYLENGGFLFANDSYSLADAIRREFKKVFPENDFVELPFSHPVYHTLYDFPNGLPKIHKHDDKPPQGFGIMINDRVCLFFAYESDIGDGWEDEEVYNDPPEKRLAALRMGANLVAYALTN
ncbi:MAG: DUF4159 domain-containing protein [Candidatus Zixiibacteriota bacterium]|nr:MAG: DUF4159 domain-containing protein [candidate division Zixibacteria bacterium]